MKKKKHAERGVLRTDEVVEENALVQQLEKPEDTIDVNYN
jgi:hypothetical protein